MKIKTFAETHHIVFMPDLQKMSDKEIESNAHLTYVTDHKSYLVVNIHGIGVHTIDDEAGEFLYDEVTFVKLHMYFEKKPLPSELDKLNRHKYNVLYADDDDLPIETYLTQKCIETELFDATSGGIRKDLRHYVIRKSFR